MNSIIDYLEFAWEKTMDGRGLSANRSMVHFSNLFYMFGRDDTDELAYRLVHYKYYGAPWLAIISDLVGYDWKGHGYDKWIESELSNPISSEELENKYNEYLRKIDFQSIRDYIQSVLSNDDKGVDK